MASHLLHQQLEGGEEGSRAREGESRVGRGDWRGRGMGMHTCMHVHIASVRRVGGGLVAGEAVQWRPPPSTPCQHPSTHPHTYTQHKQTPIDTTQHNIHKTPQNPTHTTTQTPTIPPRTWEREGERDAREGEM
jgi:hypothetical protein